MRPLVEYILLLSLQFKDWMGTEIKNDHKLVYQMEF